MGMGAVAVLKGLSPLGPVIGGRGGRGVVLVFGEACVIGERLMGGDGG
jgi:hypothetical protein